MRKRLVPVLVFAAALAATSRAAAAEMVDMPGFIAWMGVVISDRLFTITAWEDTESPQRLRHSGPHEEAVERFFSTDFATSLLTSVWKLPACSSKAPTSQPSATSATAE